MKEQSENLILIGKGIDNYNSPVIFSLKITYDSLYHYIINKNTNEKPN